MPDTYFYPRPPRGGRHNRARLNHHILRFLSTPSARRATLGGCDGVYYHAISIHALREEGDSLTTAHTSPGRYFYPRPPRGGRPEDGRVEEAVLTISIHALREEGDYGVCFKIGETGISIHALREEGDGAGLLLSTCKQLFLSTPSARRATARAGCCWQPPRDFYPRPPRGGRRKSMENQTVSARFLSTTSARRATPPTCLSVMRYIISIHALREEGDMQASTPSGWTGYFYPRPPRGGRRIQVFPTAAHQRNFYPRPPRGGRLPQPFRLSLIPAFLSTPSARRATRVHRRHRQHHRISIHALREEGDHAGRVQGEGRTHNFYPRPPRGGRPKFVERVRDLCKISIHALREEGDFGGDGDGQTS